MLLARAGLVQMKNHTTRRVQPGRCLARVRVYAAARSSPVSALAAAAYSVPIESAANWWCQAASQVAKLDRSGSGRVSSRLRLATFARARHTGEYREDPSRTQTPADRRAPRTVPPPATATRCHHRRRRGNASAASERASPAREP